MQIADKHFSICKIEHVYFGLHNIFGDIIHHKISYQLNLYFEITNNVNAIIFQSILSKLNLML